MDAIFIPSSAEKSVSPNKQFKNNILRRYSSGVDFVSKQNENLAYNTSVIHGGGGGGGGGGSMLFAPPPSLSFSYNPSPPLLNPLFYHNYQQQPPLLPLPNKPLHSSLPSRTRSLSSSPSNVKNNRNKDQKRSKPKQLCAKPVEDPKKKLQLKPPAEATKTQAVNKPFVMASAAKDLECVSSSIFKLSPPPSSLPLPSFSLRPKLSCNAEAADGGATDNLRRILRLP